jgi:predicted peroxiredoxin
MAKLMTVVCNSAEPSSLYPTFVLSSSAVALGMKVILFFTPGSASALKKGVMEGIQGKGMPRLIDLVEAVQQLGARLLLCELALEAKDIKEDELRDGIEIVGATYYVGEIFDADLSFSF